jgi:hypothetical protein
MLHLIGVGSLSASSVKPETADYLDTATIVIPHRPRHCSKRLLKDEAIRARCEVHLVL